MTIWLTTRKRIDNTQIWQEIARNCHGLAAGARHLPRQAPLGPCCDVCAPNPKCTSTPLSAYRHAGEVTQEIHAQACPREQRLPTFWTSRSTSGPQTTVGDRCFRALPTSKQQTLKASFKRGLPETVAASQTLNGQVQLVAFTAATFTATVPAGAAPCASQWGPGQVLAITTETQAPSSSFSISFTTQWGIALVLVKVCV